MLKCNQGPAGIHPTEPALELTYCFSFLELCSFPMVGWGPSPFIKAGIQKSGRDVNRHRTIHDMVLHVARPAIVIDLVPLKGALYESLERLRSLRSKILSPELLPLYFHLTLSDLLLLCYDYCHQPWYLLQYHHHCHHHIF